MIETMKGSTYSPHYAALRAWLITKREEKGLSIRDAGKLVNRHHSIIGKMEQDRRKIDILEFVEYCQKLDIDPHEGIDVILSSQRSSS